MANVLVDETALQDIADAIRTKNGTQNTYKPGQMADAIEAIPSGGITPTGTINITQNGTTDVTQYASANVAVPNSYAAADEGKVVSNGALVAQGSDTVTQNGTVDTTLIKSLMVNVPTGGSAIKSGDFTPASNTNSFSVDTGIDFSHFLIFATSNPLGTGVRTFQMSYYDYDLNLTYQISSNAGGSSGAGSGTFSTPGIKSGSTATINHGTYQYFISGKTYHWLAW